MEEHVENEVSPDWVPKKIGGIEVDQAEVRRAKKCKKLHYTMTSNTHPSTSRISIERPFCQPNASDPKVDRTRTRPRLYGFAPSKGPH